MFGIKWRKNIKKTFWRHAQESSYPSCVRQHFLAPVIDMEIPVRYERIQVFFMMWQYFRDVVKLTAQFVARNGRQFLTNLMNREQRNYQFDFLRPQHSLFNYFTKLVEQYTKVRKYESRHDKTNKMSVRPAKTQISLGICPVWSESSLSAWRKLGSLATHWGHSEDSDQTGRMPRLIWVLAGCTLILLVLSCCGSYKKFGHQ